MLHVIQFSDPKKTQPAGCTGAFVQTPAKAAEDFGSTWRNTSCLKPQLWEVDGLVDGLEKSLV